MTAGISLFDRGQFSLPRSDSRQLLAQQLRWTAGQGAATLIALSLGWSAAPYAGLAVGVGLCLARPRPSHLLPLYLLLPTATAWLVEGWMHPLAGAALGAGLLVGHSLLTRLEAAMVGMTAVLVVAWAISGLNNEMMPTLLATLLFSLATAQSLLPATIRFTPAAQVPTPRTINQNLKAAYQQPCIRAWQLDTELGKQAPDTAAREGLAEVGTWVYRLALSLQTLDDDIRRIDPEDVRQRRETLLTNPSEDSFIRERQQGTASHLERLLSHRDALLMERARSASLQEYALAYLEEARAGMALARVLPGERTPEQLTVVLSKLRSHAAEGDARRQAAREMDIKHP